MDFYCDNDDICSSFPNEPLNENLYKECSSNYYAIGNDNYSWIEGYIKYQ